MSRFLNERLSAFDAYVPGEQPGDMDLLIKLNTNESPYPPSPKVREALSGEAIDRLRLYSDLRAGALIAALAADLDVGADQIMVGNGSDEILYLAMLAFGGRGARFADVTYGFYTVWAKLIGIEQRIVPLREDFTIDPSDYAGNDRMILIANPNAPTGIDMGLPGIERIVRANPDQIVLVDEAYVDFGAQSAVGLIGRYENLIVCRTFSKSRQMAGARLGFAVGSAGVIGDLNKVRYSFHPYNVNTLTQIAGTASVLDREYFEWARAKVIATRETARAALESLGFTVMPSSANFLFARPPGAMSGPEYMRALREHGILVRRFDADRISDYLRITIGTDAQMRTLIDVTKRIIIGG